MIKIDLNMDQGVPQYSCSSCSNCKSIFGTSLCDIKNRGCCWYFPKFTLYEIHKMVQDEEGIKTLNNILSLPKVKIHNYYIHAEGYFDKAGYEEFITSEKGLEHNVKDKSIFFRACPFVKQGEGCTLPRKYRSYVCNFFICEEIVNKVKKLKVYTNYIKERDSYVSWIDWENRSLEMLLTESKLNLVNNFDEVVHVLKNIPLREYEYNNLESIVILEDMNQNFDTKLG